MSKNAPNCTAQRKTPRLSGGLASHLAGPTVSTRLSKSLAAPAPVAAVLGRVAQSYPSSIIHCRNNGLDDIDRDRIAERLIALGVADSFGPSVGEALETLALDGC